MEREVRRLIEGLKDDRSALEILRFLLPRGEVSHDAIMQHMSGYTGEGFVYFRRTSLVLERVERLPGGPRSYWKIPEEFKPALEKLLYDYIS